MEVEELYRKLTGNSFQDLIDQGLSPINFYNVHKNRHPEIPIITQGDPTEVQMLNWGVIHSFAKYIEDGNGNLVHPWDSAYEPDNTNKLILKSI